MFDISVIITSKNNENEIFDCLRSIELNKNINKEIILVDNFSTDNTLDIASKFDCKIFQKGPERSTQRNFGIKNASSEILIFLDSDMIIGPDLLRNYHQILKDRQDIIGCTIPEVILGRSIISKIIDFEREFYSDTVIDCARIFYKSNFIEAGLFDQRLIAGEDWDLDRRLRKTGKIKHIELLDFNEKAWDKNLLNFIKDNCEINKIKNSIIFHKQTNLSLINLLKKKAYYSEYLHLYIDKWTVNDPIVKKQLGFFYRFFFVFFEKKKFKKILKHPIKFTCLITLKIIIAIVYLIKK